MMALSLISIEMLALGNYDTLTLSALTSLFMLNFLHF